MHIRKLINKLEALATVNPNLDVRIATDEEDDDYPFVYDVTVEGLGRNGWDWKYENVTHLGLGKLYCIGDNKPL